MLSETLLPAATATIAALEAGLALRALRATPGSRDRALIMLHVLALLTGTIALVVVGQEHRGTVTGLLAMLIAITPSQVASHSPRVHGSLVVAAGFILVAAGLAGYAPSTLLLVVGVLTVIVGLYTMALGARVDG